MAEQRRTDENLATRKDNTWKGLQRKLIFKFKQCFNLHSTHSSHTEQLQLHHLRLWYLEKGRVKLPVAVGWSDAEPTEISSTNSMGCTAPGSAWYSG